MPYQSDSQITGDQGEAWFASQLPGGWLIQPPRRDVGVDGVVVVCDKSDLNGREFRVQIKASKSPTVRASNLVISDVKRSTLEYWFLSPLPTLIVFYDVQSNVGYFEWHSSLYEKLKDWLDHRNTKAISIQIPTQNLLNAAGWETIRKDLKSHYRSLSISLRAARNAKSLLPTIHALAKAVRTLNSTDHQPIPSDQRSDQQEGILALLDMMHHRLVVTSLEHLLSELVPNVDGSRRLEAWIRSYTSNVSSVFPNFDKLTDWNFAPPDFAIAFDRRQFHSTRFQLMDAILEMIMLLAPGQFNRPLAAEDLAEQPNLG